MKRYHLVLKLFLLCLFLFFLWKLPFFYEKTIHLQKEILQFFHQAKLQEEKSLSIFLILACFFYGFFHALGPGHGKSFLMTFLFRGNITKLQIVGMCFTIATLQGSLAFISVKILLYFAMESIFLSSFSWQDNIQIFSAILLIALGLFSFFSHKHEKRTKSNSCLYFSCALGFCPCPGIMSMLLFLHILGYENYAIFFTLAAASGMFVLLCSVAFLGKALETYFFSKALEEKQEKFEQFSSFFLIVLGIFILLSYLL